MKTPRNLVSALAIGLSFSAGTASADCTARLDPSQLTEAGKLTLAVSPTLPPMAYAESDGTLKGLRIELGEEIARRLCLEANFISTEYAAMVPGLKGGRWEVIDAGLFVTEERLKILYMIPYENLAIAISTAAGDDSVKTPEDLAGKTISSDIGGYAERKIKELDATLTGQGLKPMDIKLFDNYATVYQALRAGQVQAAVSIDPVAKMYAENGEFTAALHGLYPTPGSLAMGNLEIAEAVTETMQEMQADGWLPALMERYGVDPAEGGIVLKGMGL